MAEKIKLTVEVDKDVVKGVLAMGGGLKSGILSNAVKSWIDEHDSIELPASLLDETPELEAAMATFALLGISDELKKDLEK